MKKVIKYLLKRNNLEIKRIVGEEYFEPEFLEIYQKVKDYTTGSKERLYSLYNSINYIIDAGLEGDFVECGVWKGGCCMLIALTLLKRGINNRKIWLYDTFLGMTKPTDEDYDLLKGEKRIKVWEKRREGEFSDYAKAEIDSVKKNMFITDYPKKNLMFIKGKVEDTLKVSKPKKICLLRLDTDWYESTKIEMEELYPLLEDKGVLISDDFRCLAGTKKAIIDYFKDNDINLLINRTDDHSIIAIKT
ncbi:MAG: macrocin O-methyltransferase [Candidatus Nanoarchaeia archaeon]|nr:macrocin O-methyltransferase [Candidatus Nanoarchaeia archaeon]MDD5741416.1 macrocin O-methyltransferase [Candidatus Nanoarchaeia archaeon]